jgi:enoyl-CoA hydratase
MTTRASLQVEIENHVAEVTLLGPGKGNAMGPDAWREVPEVFAELDANDDVRVVLLRGSGEHFCYGIDLMAMSGELGGLIMGTPGAKERAELHEKILELQGTITSVARCKKPVVAAVQGWCIGAGLDLISACDVRVCEKGARFSLREVKVAMVADVGSLQRLPYIIGDGATRELALTGGDIDAARALKLGLVSDVVAPAELEAKARGLAEAIAANPPNVVQGIKQVMNRRIDDEIEAGLRHVATWNSAFLPSEDLTEAFAAFAEKRAPAYKGA